MNIRSKINAKESSISFVLNTKLYPQDIIYRTCYALIDRTYIYLDSPRKDVVEVLLKGKEKLNAKNIEALRGEFSNELLNNILHEKIARKNKGIVEYIMSGAITAAMEKGDEIPGPDAKNEESLDILNIEKEIAALKAELDSLEIEEYENDPLQIKKIANVEKKKNGKK